MLGSPIPQNEQVSVSAPSLAGRAVSRPGALLEPISDRDVGLIGIQLVHRFWCVLV